MISSPVREAWLLLVLTDCIEQAEARPQASCLQLLNPVCLGDEFAGGPELGLLSPFSEPFISLTTVLHSSELTRLNLRLVFLLG